MIRTRNMKWALVPTMRTKRGTASPLNEAGINAAAAGSKSTTKKNKEG